MDKLQILKAWLESFSGWAEAQWNVDLSGNTPVSCCLSLEDDRVMRRTENVLGNSRLQFRTQFSLTRVSFWEDAPSRWVEEFSAWVAEQSELGAAPRLGQGVTRYRLEKGKLTESEGKAVYSVKLIGTYEKIFEVNRNEN